MIIFPADFDQYKKFIGPKALHLAALQALDVKVPKFIALSSKIVMNIWTERQIGQTSLIDALILEITKAVPAPYAVRSSALIEDTLHDSQAGQFLTRTDLTRDDLKIGILDVIAQAEQKLSGKLELFSLVIQQYVEADYAGVTFTRNPLGGRSMVIEYQAGAGENVVGGKTTPHRQELFWNDTAASVPLPRFDGTVDAFKKIEEHYGHPQDIEWCLAGEEYFFLQTRPITTISDAQYAEVLYLDEHLTASGNFLFEKTEIAEIAPRPTPFTFSLLEQIYAAGGPIDQTYRKFGVRYDALNFLMIVGNELYANREQELKTLLPAFSYFINGKLTPALSSLRGLLRTIFNLFRITTINADHADLYRRLDAALQHRFPQDISFDVVVDDFLKDYALIFEVNLVADKKIKQLSYLLKDDIHMLPQLINSSDTTQQHPMLSHEGLLGNSLEISDTTDFSNEIARSDADAGRNYLAHQPALRKMQLEPAITEAQAYNRLREYGRWMTVKHISRMRSFLLALGHSDGLRDPGLVFFATVPEIIHHSYDSVKLQERKEIYDSLLKYNFPNRLSNVIVTQPQMQPLAASPGIAQGILMTADEIGKNEESAILYTQLLTPDLVALFPKIKGIISEKGGVLSHLAIMAREHHVPVMVNVDLTRLGIKIGDEVYLNADEGVIRKIN